MTGKELLEYAKDGARARMELLERRFHYLPENESVRKQYFKAIDDFSEICQLIAELHQE